MAGLKALNINTPPEAEPHIYAEDDAAIYKAIFGGDGVSTIGQACKATVLSNNKVRIADGVLCVDGHMARIPYGEYEDCEIMNGQSGKNRNDIIAAKFETTGTGGIDTMTCEVIQGTAGETATDPELAQDDTYAGGKVREYPLYRVKIEGLSITAVEKMFEVIPTNKELVNGIAKLTSNSFKCELTQLTTKAFRASPKATVMRLDKQYDYSDFKMIGFCIINMSTSDSVTHRQWQWLPTRWLQDNLLNQSSSSSYANRRLIFNFSRGGGGQRAWIYGSTNDGLNFIKGSDDTDNYNCSIFGLR